MHHGRWSPEEIIRVRDLLNETAKAVVDGPHSRSEKSVLIHSNRSTASATKSNAANCTCCA
jgi:hypothetical protein